MVEGSGDSTDGATSKPSSSSGSGGLGSSGNNIPPKDPKEPHSGKLIPGKSPPPKGVELKKPGQHLENGDYIDPRDFTKRVRNQDYSNKKGWILSKENAYNSGARPHGKDAWKLISPNSTNPLYEVAIDGKIFRVKV